MTLEWDYTELADSYSKRPPYSGQLLENLFCRVGGRSGMQVCDMGAGTGNLTVPLAEQRFGVAAVEPNAAMRAIGQRRTGLFPWVAWYPTTAESTGLASSRFDLVAFASSFNVVKQDKALAESWRLLRPGGWFTCLWNYRDLNDPLQHGIEGKIRSLLPNYEYGNRRQDQTATIQASGLFGMTEALESFHVQRVSRSDWLDAWKSHATLRRQAGDRFPVVLEAIRTLLAHESEEILEVRYVTRAWLAQKRGMHSP